MDEFQDGKIRSYGSIFLASPLGGDVEKISDFQDGKIRSHASIFWQERKLVMHGQKKCIKAILTKMAIFKKGNQSCIVRELVLTWGRS